MNLVEKSLDDLSDFWKRDVKKTRERIEKESYEDDNGILRWHLSNKIVPPRVLEEDARLECPEPQWKAYQEQLDDFLEGYLEERKKRGYSEEEKSEMRSAFGKNEIMMDVLTGERINL